MRTKCARTLEVGWFFELEFFFVRDVGTAGASPSTSKRGFMEKNC